MSRLTPPSVCLELLGIEILHKVLGYCSNIFKVWGLETGQGEFILHPMAELILPDSPPLPHITPRTGPGPALLHWEMLPHLQTWEKVTW